jgi:hypothetical protein
MLDFRLVLAALTVGVGICGHPTAGIGAPAALVATAQPVAALYDHLASINGARGSAMAPLICFDTGISTLPNPGTARNHSERRARQARLRELEEPVTELARLLVAAHRESGSLSGAIHVRVIGHADETGEAELNPRLSVDRAQTIAGLLRREISKQRDGGKIKLDIEAEGRGQYAPWPDRDAKCGRAENIAELAGVEIPPADRRVEIEITSGALTTAGPELDKRLRIYPTGTMPWRPVSLPVNDVDLTNVDACKDGDSFLGTPWIAIAPINAIDANDGKLVLRLQAAPVFHKRDGALSKQVRVLLELARDANDVTDLASLPAGAGIPGYWAVHERALAFLKETIALEPASKPDWLDTKPASAYGSLKSLIQKISACLGKDNYLAISREQITFAALDRLPKDIDGVMAHAHGLHRHLRFVDIRPGTTLVFKGQAVSPFQRDSTSLSIPPVPDTTRLLGDPINPCKADPEPNEQVRAIADPFIAWMMTGEEICPLEVTAKRASETAQGGGGESDALPEATAANSAWQRIWTQSEFELILSKGAARFFLPRDMIFWRPNLASDVDLSSKQNSSGTIVMGASDPKTIRDITRSAAPSTSRNRFAVASTCEGQKQPAVFCGYLIQFRTFSLLVPSNVNSSPANLALGTRVVQVVPPAVSNPCLMLPGREHWKDGARTGAAVIWSHSMLPRGALADRFDCRVLALPVVEGSQVSW